MKEHYANANCMSMVTVNYYLHICTYSSPFLQRTHAVAAGVAVGEVVVVVPGAVSGVHGNGAVGGTTTGCKIFLISFL